jgi:type IV pilus assembly protein PilM
MELVTYAVSQQIPCPLADLHWDFEAFHSASAKTPNGSAILQPVVVAAMRTRDVRDQVQVFDSLGLTIHIVQAESLALHNFLCIDHFSSIVDQNGPSLSAIGLLDIGAEASNLVVSSPQSVWFRTLRYGTNDVNQALIREFKLTFDQAEELKRKLGKARRLRSLLEVFDVNAGKLVAEVQRSLETRHQEQLDQSVQNIWLCGGGANQFGLLTQCRTGAFTGNS